MFRALISKELRENTWIALVALLVYACAALTAMGASLSPWTVRGVYEIPFVGGDFTRLFLYIAITLATVLGFRQTLAESIQDTWLFILHRPVQRHTILASKLLVGLILYLACGAVPILVYASWAATPGTHPSPFEWSMTLTAWTHLACVTLLYFGAFLSGLRPARWKASRLFPLLTAGVFAFLIELVPWWWILGSAALVVTCAWFVVSILYMGESCDLG
jgi:hypothetical protein